jgi:methyl-accepting chemotaxis protein
MNRPTYQRKTKNLLLDWGFQGGILMLIAATGLLCIGITAFLGHAYVADSYAFIFKHSSLPQDLMDARYSDLYRFLLSLTLLNGVIVLVVAGWTVLVTHRAAGSVFHIKRVIGEIRAGDLAARVRLRQKDEFRDLAHLFNEMMDELQKR